MAPAGGGDVAESDRDPLSDAVTEPSGCRSSHCVPGSTPSRRSRLSSCSEETSVGDSLPPAARELFPRFHLPQCRATRSPVRAPSSFEAYGARTRLVSAPCSYGSGSGCLLPRPIRGAADWVVSDHVTGPGRSVPETMGHAVAARGRRGGTDRKSTRLNSSHVAISY